MQCDSGAIEPEIEFDCKDNWIDYEQGTYCTTSATFGVMCHRPDGYIYYGPNCEY